MTIEQLIITLSYFGILLLMTINGIIAFPSSQLIYIIAGIFAYAGDLNVILVILIGALGHTIGNYILYEIARRKGIDYSLKFLKILTIAKDPRKEIKKVEIAFKKKGNWFLFIGKLVNPIKIFIPIPAGISKMPRVTFLIISYITSTIWATIFTLIGYYFGKSYENFGFIGLGMLIIFVTVIIYFYKYINSQEILNEIEKTN